MPVLRVIASGRISKQDVKKLDKFVRYLLLMRDRSVLDVCDVKFCAFDHRSDDPQVNLLI
uniref:Uncharacterized protein n=1 Tax=Arundo donax TaxID=35708 RepID=A0A0A8Z4J5_ARUDO